MAGPCLNTLTIKDGKRQTIADAYLAPALGRPNLHLMAETQVLSLVFDGTRCRGVRLSDRHGERVVTAGRVILAAGTIASPMLLMRSGIGAADELRALGIARTSRSARRRAQPARPSAERRQRLSRRAGRCRRRTTRTRNR